MAELFNFPKLAIALLVLFAIFVPLERLAPIVRRDFWQRPGVWADLGHFFISGGIRKFLLFFVLVVLTYWAGFLVYPPLQHWLAAWPKWSQFLAAIFVHELGSYWGHRLAHTVPALWRFHAVHHSSEQMDWLAASRVHPVDQTFIRCCAILPVYLLGFTKETFGFLIAIDGLLAIFIHANVRWRLGWIERIVATPAFHHWHHANEGPAAANKNLSGLLPCVDWIFGTLHLPPTMPQRYGIDQPMPQNYHGQLLAPFRRQPPEPTASATLSARRAETEAALD